MRWILCIGASLMAAGVALGQTTYHVAPPPAGNDANPGTAAAPFATIQRGAQAAQAGDTVVVAPGTYAGFNAVRSGAPGVPITFRGEPGAVIATAAAPHNGNNHRSRINLDSVSWIVIEGFEVVGTHDQRNSNEGIRLVAPPGFAGGDVVIRNCHVHHHGNRCIFSGHYNRITIEECLIHGAADEHGVYLSNSGDDHVIRRNVIHSNAAAGIHLNADASEGGDGVMTGLLVEANVIFNNAVGANYIDINGTPQTRPGGGSGINCDGVRDSRIVSNLLYGNHASGISLYRIDGLLGAGNNVVANNTVVQPSDGRWALNIQDDSSGNVLFNNILLNFHSFRGSIDISAASLPGLVSNRNIVMDRFMIGGASATLAGWRAATGQDADSVALPASAWPALFVDLAGDDYRLPPGSIARDAGIPALGGRAAPRTDAADERRPQGRAYDIGAHEHIPECPADWNGDGVPTSADISAFLSTWLMGAVAENGLGDFNGDGPVTSTDIAAFLTAWLEAVTQGC